MVVGLRRASAAGHRRAGDRLGLRQAVGMCRMPLRALLTTRSDAESGQPQRFRFGDGSVADSASRWVLVIRSAGSIAISIQT